MGGFLGALRAVGEGIASQSTLGTAIAENLDPSFQPAQQNQQGLLGAAGRYMRNRRNAQDSPNAPSNYDADVPGVVPAHLTDPSDPNDPNRYMGQPPLEGPDPGQVAASSQWNQPPTAGRLPGLASLAAASGTVVTSPTIAKIGEKGPEMVVPLKARGGNRIQPDVLEGHITPPKSPNIRYSRYRSFTDRSL
jgi:hypothetical protein